MNTQLPRKTNGLFYLLSLVFIFFYLVPPRLNGQVKWTYSINHRKIPTTKLVFTFGDTSFEKGSEYFELKVSAKNQNIFNLLFRVENEFRTLIETRTLLPVQMKKQINQKNIQEVTTIRYDQRSCLAHKDTTFSWQLPVACHNYFSMLFFLRAKPLDSGDCYSFYLDVEHLVWQVKARVGDLQQLELNNQKLPAIRVDLSYRPWKPNQSRPWKTDILTNRIAKEGGGMIVWIRADQIRQILRVDYDEETFMLLTKTEPDPR